MGSVASDVPLFVAALAEEDVAAPKLLAVQIHSLLLKGAAALTAAVWAKPYGAWGGGGGGTPVA